MFISLILFSLSTFKRGFWIELKPGKLFHNHASLRYRVSHKIVFFSCQFLAIPLGCELCLAVRMWPTKSGRLYNTSLVVDDTSQEGEAGDCGEKTQLFWNNLCKSLVFDSNSIYL